MKSISNFIIEKLKINKNTKNDNIDDYCIVQPFNELYDEFLYKFKKNYVHGGSDGSPDMFLVNKRDIKKYEDDSNLYAYEIPSHYNNLEDVKQEYLDGLIHTDDLKDVDFREY